MNFTKLPYRIAGAFLAGAMLAILPASCARAAAPTTAPAVADAPVDPADYVKAIRVACVGDSITFGGGSSQREVTSWVGVLGRMLDRHWQVTNFGVGGRTVLKKGNMPYQTTGPMKKALASKPDVVIIMLGTNDTKPQNWQYKDQFVADYQDMIDQFKALPSQPKIFLCLPPVVTGENGPRIQAAGVEAELPMIRQIAKDENAGIIDVNTASIAIPEDFPDHVHPNDAGAIIIAKTVYAALTGKTYAGDPPPPPPPAHPATQP